MIGCSWSLVQKGGVSIGGGVSWRRACCALLRVAARCLLACCAAHAPLPRHPLNTATHSRAHNHTQHAQPPATAAAAAARFKDSFLSPPRSLEFDRGGVAYPAALEGNPLGRAFLTLIGAYGRKQRLLNGASVLHRAIAEAAEDARLYEGAAAHCALRFVAAPPPPGCLFQRATAPVRSCCCVGRSRCPPLPRY